MKNLLMNSMAKFGLSLILVLVFSQLHSQTLQELQLIAAQNNPGIEAKYKEFEAAMQSAKIDNKLADPTLSLGYFISPVETRVGPQRLKLSLSQMFPWFGTLESRGKTAEYLAEAKYQMFIEARNKLYVELAKAYFELDVVRQKISIEQSNNEVLETYKLLAIKKFANGAGSMVDVLRVDLTLNESKTELEILNLQQQPLEILINSLLNREENTPISTNSVDKQLIAFDVDMDSAFNEHPLLKELDLKLKASKQIETTTALASMPKLGLGLDYVIVGKSTANTSSESGRDVWMPMVSASIPIFQRKYRAMRKRAELNTESLELIQNNTENKLVIQLAAIQSRIESQIVLGELYNDQIEESNQALNLLLSQYRNASSGFDEVLIMQQQLLKYQKLKLVAIAKYHMVFEELEYITSKHNNDEVEY